MTIWLALAAIAIGVCDGWLITVCWTRHTMLGRMAGVIGVGLLGFAVTTGLRGGPGEVAVVGALCVGIVGAELLGLGQILEWLLEM